MGFRAGPKETKGRGERGMKEKGDVLQGLVGLFRVNGKARVKLFSSLDFYVRNLGLVYPVFS